MDFNLNNDRQFNNPDSFAIAFDDAWDKVSRLETTKNLKIQDKMQTVLEKIQDHPFIRANHKEAKEIAMFRIKLLSLD